MRPPKYRAKPMGSNEWIYGGGAVEIIGEGYRDTFFIHLDSGGRLAVTKIQPETLGRWTSFYDKSGNEIYTGDIFKDEWGSFWAVDWNDEAGAYVVGGGGDALFGNWIDDETEVHGNIFDNPELLK